MNTTLIRFIYAYFTEISMKVNKDFLIALSHALRTHPALHVNCRLHEKINATSLYIFGNAFTKEKNILFWSTFYISF